ncbi:MAG: hypothetical protein LBJ60_09000 [Tannerellaceae bacterium]|jgi:tetratricopeptide (TPR) repeat protein|nr:hypothetical protein [Tannerellaceae bacterium]
MKTKLICIFLFFSLLAYSQKILIYQEDISKAKILTDGDENTTTGEVEIECSASIPLTFESELLGKLTPSAVTNNGETVNYRIALNRSRHFVMDELFITNPQYRRLTIPLNSLERKQKKYFLVYDPNLERDLSCYLSTVEKADLSFKTALYDQAKEEYKQATECWDYKKDSRVEKMIQNIDSIASYTKDAESAYNLSDFRRAGELYQRAFNLNQNDKVLEDKKNDAIRRFTNFCADCYNTAERYFEERNYDEAKAYYEKVVKQNCNGSAQSNLRLSYIDGRLTQRYHSVSYEFAGNTPIGFSTGNYKEFYKVGGYFSLRFNSKMFELIRDEDKLVEKAEANVSFGWTVMLYKPVWLFFGPGFTTVSEYVLNNPDDSDDSGQVIDNLPVAASSNTDNLKLQFRNAISPEIGLLGKIPIMGKDWITLRYTFQYRFALKKADESYIGKTKHVFGIGLCF